MQALAGRGDGKVALPAVEAKVVAASLPAVASEPPEQAATESPPTLAADAEGRPTQAASLDQKAARSEKNAFDLSPVRDVGF